MLSGHGACRDQLRTRGTKRKKARGKSFPSPSSKKLSAASLLGALALLAFACLVLTPIAVIATISVIGLLLALFQ